MESVTSVRSGAIDALNAFLHFREEDMKLWRRAGSELGLTATAMHVLSAIARAQARSETVRASDVRERLGYSAAGTSAAVASLVALGVIEQQQIEDDRRSFALMPTEAGAGLLAQVRHHDEYFASLVDGLDEASMTAVTRVLQGMGDYSAGRFPED